MAKNKKRWLCNSCTYSHISLSTYRVEELLLLLGMTQCTWQTQFLFPWSLGRWMCKLMRAFQKTIKASKMVKEATGWRVGDCHLAFGGQRRHRWGSAAGSEGREFGTLSGRVWGERARQWWPVPFWGCNTTAKSPVGVHVSGSVNSECGHTERCL